MSKRKSYSKAFHAALSYLHDDMGHNACHIATVLTQMGLPIKHTAVHYWCVENRLPHSQAMINIVIAWAEYSRRLDCLIADLHAKIDEFEVTLQGSIDYLKEKGDTYEGLAELADYKDGRTISGWHKGRHKPWQVNELYGLKMAPDLPDRRTWKIMGKYSEKIGITEKLFYALYPIFERNLDLVVGNDDDEKIWQQWTEWTEWTDCCAEYEKRKAQGIVEG